MGIDESRSKNRHPSQQRSSRRLSFRSLLCEHLERREVMDAAGIFDAGTDPAYFARMTDQLRLLGSGDGGQNQGGVSEIHRGVGVTGHKLSSDSGHEGFVGNEGSRQCS